MFVFRKAALVWALFTVTATVMVAQTRPEPGTYFPSMEACKAAKPGEFTHYTPTIYTGVVRWDSEISAGRASLGSTGDTDWCGVELTNKDGMKLVRIPAHTPLYLVNGIVVADGRCGNPFKGEPVNKTEVAIEAPPPTPAPRIERPRRERQAPPSVTAVASVGTCEAILSTYGLDKLGSDAAPIVIWPEISNGTAVRGGWGIGDTQVGSDPRLTLNPRQLYKTVEGKAGTYELAFWGSDAHGNTLSCAVDITLVKQGRHWFWKLPGIHCVYAYTHDIKKWKGRHLAEKGVCLVEAGVAYYFWPVKTAKLLKPIGTPGGAGILP